MTSTDAMHAGVLYLLPLSSITSTLLEKEKKYVSVAKLSTKRNQLGAWRMPTFTYEGAGLTR
jgi:hypothetical protein